ncbi:zinc-dependent alcohol dehydrogenase [Marinitenerispora sediminis]|uniref:Glutathione-dependent formaldehyde dehydrogenase n=1 Tax=Marinitenerispora sediminis TaxID=1931232 RepID=A0A368T6R7_9ACTN|nr:zinc-dependent alcohol dehydrogenase [Marinitenerispora sediminis]RCV52529.1 glutathione-dependent formaldehyde dehydrogenase [Marinitenerispora sediminis]RCV59488.1 glutathione-dependent formaldehyde dehydrogenase [Marinitenerispora sediminis]RCV59595.1 glutathione-dependent formaldehyde dehydrogenase [Marinitenerispora sediminis]
MRAVTWQGPEDVRTENVPDPQLREPTDAIVRITSTAICGSDLHLYSVLGMYMEPGDILGHEPMGVVEEVGSEVTAIVPGDRVVIPFNVSCGHCYMCRLNYYSQCETTQTPGHGGALLGYTKLYGHVPGGQAEYLRVPQAHFGPIRVPDGLPDERFLFLSDVLPTAWQAVADADVPPAGSVAVVGLGPIGQMAARIALERGAGRVFGLDLVPERLEMARRHGVETVDVSACDPVEAVRAETEGRGTDSVIEAVGMEAHGSPVGALAQRVVRALPDPLARRMAEQAGVDRMSALYLAFELVRRAGAVSISGVYGGQADPLPMMDLFDKAVQIRMGQANVRRWTDAIMPLLTGDEDPLGVGDLTTHVMSLDDAPLAYELFQQKRDGAIKMVLRP